MDPGKERTFFSTEMSYCNVLICMQSKYLQTGRIKKIINWCEIWNGGYTLVITLQYIINKEYNICITYFLINNKIC